jgi:hypothetical protein
VAFGVKLFAKWFARLESEMALASGRTTGQSGEAGQNTTLRSSEVGLGFIWFVRMNGFAHRHDLDVGNSWEFG